jgi:hypothetical protein
MNEYGYESPTIDPFSSPDWEGEPQGLAPWLRYQELREQRHRAKELTE